MSRPKNNTAKQPRTNNVKNNGVKRPRTNAENVAACRERKRLEQERQNQELKQLRAEHELLQSRVKLEEKILNFLKAAAQASMASQ